MWTLILTMRVNTSHGPAVSVVAVPGFRSEQLAKAAGAAWVAAEPRMDWGRLWERSALVVALEPEFDVEHTGEAAL